MRVEQACLLQQMEGVTQCCEMTAQTSAGGITDLQFPYQDGIVNSAPVEIAHRFGVIVESLSIKSGSLFQHRGGIDCGTGLRIEAGKALAERQMPGQLDKANQIATLATAVAVENILARVDIERRPGLLVQRTESD